MATKEEFEASINTDTSVFRKVTAIAVAEFLASKNASNTCPSCGQEAWNFESPLPSGHPLALLFHPPLPGRHTYMPLIVLTCDNCGFAKSHTLGPFLEWLKSREGKS
jgi:predicted RNA-binding Zn-ribbon protein involved in translation (DUF1610 family)